MTRLDEVQHPYRPTIQHQLPDSVCKIVDDEDILHFLGADSCTAYSGAHYVDRMTEGRQKPSGCAIRKGTRPLDTTGGLTLPQVAKVIRDHYGIAVSEFVGANVVTPQYLARQLRAGRPAIVQGNTAAYLATPYKVTAGDVNHAEFWNEVRGGTLDEPAEVLVFDSCADHRHSDIDQGPTWIPWPIGKRFLAYLRPGGPGTARLGPGKVYCGIGPDTEPHVKLLNGGRQARPFPDRVRAALAKTPIHSKPKRGKATTTRYVAKGTLLRFFQYVEGDEWKGDRTWGANDDGTEFVHLANVTHEGGDT